MRSIRSNVPRRLPRSRIAEVALVGTDGAACLPQQHLERLHRVLVIEHVAGPHRALAGELLREIGVVDALNSTALIAPSSIFRLSAPVVSSKAASTRANV
jgi:hypothetical protein